MHESMDKAFLESTDGQSSASVRSGSQLLFNIPVPAHSTMFGCFQIMLNTAIGSGTLMIPYTYTGGIILALAVSAIFGFLAYMALHFMVDASYAVKKYDYHGLWVYCFGEKYMKLLNCAIVLTQFGAIMIYAHWNGKLINTLLPEFKNVIISSNQFWIMLITGVVVFPLTVFKSIAKLERFAMLSTFFIILLIVHAIYWVIRGSVKDEWPLREGELVIFDITNWKVIIAAFGINCMAFMCSVNLFPCLEHLENCTVNRARILAALTMASAYALYHIFGIFTYLNFYDALHTHNSALEYYDSQNPFTMITMAGVIVILVISSPIVCWASRNNLNQLFWGDEPPTNLRWVGVGGGICLTAAFIACTSENVLIFFDFVGGIFTPLVTLLLPTIFYLKCKKDASTGMKVLAVFTAIFTVIGIGACTYQAVDEIKDAF